MALAIVGVDEEWEDGMREIKFRAWADGKMFHQTVSCWWYFGSWGYWSLNVGDEPGEILCDSLESEDPILMQFTGLLDKFGKEIYEGDVVDTDGYIFEVGYITAVGTYITTGMFKDSSEIISNIYENPELIR